MNIHTLDELRAWLGGKTPEKPDAGSLQRRWKERAQLDFLRELDLARLFVKCALGLGELLLASDAARAALEVHRGDRDLRRRRANVLAQIGATARARELLVALVAEDETDSEALSLLGRTWKDVWQQHHDPAALDRAFDCYRRAFSAATDDPAYPGINAATLALLRDDRAAAKEIADRVLGHCEAQPGGGDYWTRATRAEALAVLGRVEEARAAYLEAVPLAAGRLRDLGATRRQARLLSQKLLGCADGFDGCFPVQRLVVFSGHMVDESGRRPPRFPPAREGEVRAAIAAKLDELDAKIGFASAACGADILFLEEMLARGGRIHVVLPWARAQFIETSVQRPGDAESRWQERFERVLELAASVHELGELYMPSGAVGFEYCNLVLNGRARLTARWLDLEVRPVALWDGARGQPGGTGDFVRHWKRSRVEVDTIPLIAPAATGQSVGADEQEEEPDAIEHGFLDTARQEIKAMLFADVVGYSKLPEDKIPKFVSHFMKSVSVLISGTDNAPIYTNTWGDALYFVFNRVEQAGRFAIELRDFVLNTNWAQHDLVWTEDGETRGLSIRIGLHAGPVYVNFDPVIRQVNFTGAHVSRAARVEPVTEHGCVYATEEFAALSEAQNAGGFRCDFIGTVELAKHHGPSRLYELRLP